MNAFVRQALATIALMIVSVGTSQAALIFYTDRAAWTAAAGTASFAEDFSSFTADTSFQTTAVALQGMSIQQQGVNTLQFRNIIDVPPLQYAIEGDATANASMFTDFGATTVRISFNALNAAYGADSFAADDDEGAQLEVFDGTTLLGSQALTNGSGAFLGYVLTGGTVADSIVYASVTNSTNGGEGFGLDNLVGVNAVTTSVPEPETISLFGLGIAACWFGGRRRPSESRRTRELRN